MREFTLLDDAMWAFGDLAGRDRIGQARGRHHSVGTHDTGGEQRLVFDAGEGPAVAEAKQESRDRRLSPTCESGRVGQKWVSRHVLATCR